MPNKLSKRVRSACLVGTGLSMLFAGQAAWAGSPPEPAKDGRPAEGAEVSGEVVVTARRQQETALKVPESITAFGESTLAKLNIQSFNDYATKIPNLSFSYGTSTVGFGASRAIAIRGISGAGTTAYYIDDTPIPDTVDPQVVDIQRIEVLKGPRGTLYGEGSLGGNVRMITNRPSLTKDELRVSAEGGYTDHAATGDYMGNVVGNVAIVPDKVGLRVVGFASQQGGFMDRTYLSPTGQRVTVDNQAAETSYGGSASLRVDFTSEFSATARIMAQEQKFHGFPAADAPLPAFTPSNLTVNRDINIQEKSSDRWYLPSLELAYDNELVTVTSSTSYFNRRATTLEDGSEQTGYLLSQFYGLPNAVPANGIPWLNVTTNKRFNEEVRTSFKGNDWINGVIGARYAKIRASTIVQSGDIPALVTSGYSDSPLGWYSNGPDLTTRDYSVFGELYLHHSGYELTLGLRQYWLRQEGFINLDGFLAGGPSSDTGLTARASGVNPKIALSHTLGREGLVYFSASKGFRAGTVTTPLPSTCDAGLTQLGVTAAQLRQVNPDTVWNYELGAKQRIGRMSVTGAVFRMDWNDIQQVITIPVCGIPIQANAGAARVQGFEFELAGEVFPGMDVRAGVGYNDAKIVDAGISGQPVGSRVFQIPKVTASLAGTYTWTLNSGWDTSVSADYSYTGDSVSGVTVGNPVRPSYEIVNARLNFMHDTLEVGLFARNLFNSRANLGDINPISYPLYDNAGNPIPRVVVLRPRQIGVSTRFSF